MILTIEKNRSVTILLMVLGLIYLISSAGLALADLASPHLVHETQPDGTKILLRVKGNHILNWQEDMNGYTVLKQKGNSGKYLYARQGPNGKLIPTSHEVGKVNPKAVGLKKRTLPSKAAQAQMRADGPGGQSADEAATGAPGQVLSSGSLKNLVVLIRFADHATRTLPSQSDINILMNAVGGDEVLAPAGSLRDIYLNNSYGALEINSTVVAWATVPGNEDYYAAGNSGLNTTIHLAIRDALEIIDPLVDFSIFDQDNDGYIDAITFLHSGYGAEWGGTSSDGAAFEDRIWSHKWSLYSLPDGNWTSEESVKVYNYHISPAIWGTSGSNIGRIGVIAHETGHFLGLPDLYDTDSTAGDGIGSWGLMANSWGGDGSQQPPPLMSPWSKATLGWISYTDLSVPGEDYSIGDSLNSSNVFQVSSGYPTSEYLLIENRKRKNNVGKVVDNIPSDGDGLAIWHIDDLSDYNTQGYPSQAGWPENGNHYKVALLQADGNYNLEKGNNRGDNGDTYRGGSVDAIGPGSSPSTDAYQLGSVGPNGHEISFISAAAQTMYFDFNASDIPQYPPAAPGSLTASETGHYSIQLSWNDNSDNEDGFGLERSPDGINFTPLDDSISANSTGYTDQDLLPGSTYSYQLYAFNPIGSSAYSNQASATTTAPVPPTIPMGLTATVISETEIDLDWQDGENATSLEVWRSTGGGYSTIDTLGPNIMEYSDTGLQADTEYTYKIVAMNSDGSAESAPASATTQPPPPMAYVFGEYSTAATILYDSSFEDTLADDSSVETLQETLSGKNKNARSILDHTWQLGPVSGGAMVTLTISASRPANSEGDDFDFFYSNDGGVNFTYLLTVDSDTPAQYVSQLAAGTTGTVHLLVQDSDNSRGASQLDTLNVNYLMIESIGEITPTSPSNLSGEALSDSEVGLTWNDAVAEDGYSVEYRIDSTPDWSLADSGLAADSTSYTVTGLLAETSYHFQVCAIANSAGKCTETTAPITTLGTSGGDALVLTAIGVKRGVQRGELSWSGGTGGPVDIYRDGNFIITIPETSYSDNIGSKSGGPYSYKVCETGSSEKCSNEAQVF